MKQKKIHFNFSNFNKSLSNQIYDNELVPNKYYNIDLNTNTISPAEDFSNYYEKIFSKDEYIFMKNNYKSILDNILNFQIYEYYDTFSNSYKVRYFFIDNTYNLLEYSNKVFNNFNIPNFTQIPLIINNDNNIYFYCNEFLCYISGENAPIISTTSTLISNYVNFKNELFFTNTNDKYTIYITPKTNLENIYSDLSLYTKLTTNPNNGEILKLANIKNKLYIFQEYNISYIEINAKNYNLIDIFNIDCKIIKESISKNESYIYFQTTNGVYIFDGNDIEKIHATLFQNIKPSNNDIGLTYNNAYFLKTTYSDNISSYDIIIKITNNQIPVIYKPGNIENLFLFKTHSHYDLIIKNQNSEFLFFNKNLSCKKEKYLKFNKITFNSSIKKYISKISILGTGKYIIKILSDISNKNFSLENNSHLTNINIPGSVFEFEIFSNLDFEIESIFITLDIIEESND